MLTNGCNVLGVFLKYFFGLASYKNISVSMFQGCCCVQSEQGKMEISDFLLKQIIEEIYSLVFYKNLLEVWFDYDLLICSMYRTF